MVRASWPISAGPAVGIEVAKSPWPRRTAASVSASAGRVTRQPNNTPATSASTANTKAVTMRRQISALTDAVGFRGGSAGLDERDAFAGRGEHREARGVQPEAVDALHGEASVGQRLGMQRREFVVGRRVEGAIVDAAAYRRPLCSAKTFASVSSSRCTTITLNELYCAG